MNELKIHYQTVSLQTIIEYYARGFQSGQLGEIHSCETVAVDPVRKLVVFKIYTKPATNTQTKNHESQ